MNERQLLKAASEGDQRAYAELVEAHRGPLYAHCYRMLGSVQDAEDALQEALLNAWKALGRFEPAARCGRGCTRSRRMPACG